MADILSIGVALSGKFSEQKTGEEIGEMLDQLSKLLDRTKVLYEQYFMGIQKMAPSQLHRDIERRIREITQLQIRNTGLRFRFATISQKFGSYNTYWRRTMRKIERGEYIRDIARVGRNAVRRGEEIPAEILAKIPERMRKRILRDRDRMAARAARKADEKKDVGADSTAASAATISSDEDRGAEKVRDPRSNIHDLSLDDDLDMDSIFASLTSEEPSGSASSTANTANTDFDERPGTYAKARTLDPSRTRAAASRTSGSGKARVVQATKKSATKKSVPPLPARPPGASASSAAQGANAAGATPTRPPGMSERESRVLYEQYAKARRLVGETRTVSYVQLMNKLGKQTPKIMRDYNAKGVDFSVIIKGNKVVLKAKPKKD